MASCNFNIDFVGVAGEVLSTAKEMVEKVNGSFDGNENFGNYKLKLPVGQIEGRYTVNGQTITFEITRKPMLVPCVVIEGFLREQFKRSA